MSTSAIVGIVIVVIAVATIVATAGRILVQRRELHERYGDEYQRVVTEKGGRAAAEAELKRRERAHEKLQLTELSPEVRSRFRSSWTDLQGQFVEDPKAAVHAADRLVSELVAERGYPVVDYSDRLAHLSVEHAGVLNLYRSAHDVSLRNDAGTATTEDLRQALVSYRELIADLLGDTALVNGAAASTMDAVVDADPAAVTPTDTADDDMPAVVSPPASENPAPATPAQLRTDDLPDLDAIPEPVRTPAAPARDH
jgi:hypothetical protein